MLALKVIVVFTAFEKPKKRSRGQETVAIVAQAQGHPDEPRRSRKKQ